MAYALERQQQQYEQIRNRIAMQRANNKSYEVGQFAKSPLTENNMGQPRATMQRVTVKSEHVDYSSHGSGQHQVRDEKDLKASYISLHSGYGGASQPHPSRGNPQYNIHNRPAMHHRETSSLIRDRNISNFRHQSQEDPNNQMISHRDQQSHEHVLAQAQREQQEREERDAMLLGQDERSELEILRLERQKFVLEKAKFERDRAEFEAMAAGKMLYFEQNDPKLFRTGSHQHHQLTNSNMTRTSSQEPGFGISDPNHPHVSASNQLLPRITMERGNNLSNTHIGMSSTHYRTGTENFVVPGIRKSNYSEQQAHNHYMQHHSSNMADRRFAKGMGLSGNETGPGLNPTVTDRSSTVRGPNASSNYRKNFQSLDHDRAYAKPNYGFVSDEDLIKGQIDPRVANSGQGNKNSNGSNHPLQNQNSNNIYENRAALTGVTGHRISSQDQDLSIRGTSKPIERHISEEQSSQLNQNSNGPSAPSRRESRDVDREIYRKNRSSRDFDAHNDLAQRIKNASQKTNQIQNWAGKLPTSNNGMKPGQNLLAESGKMKSPNFSRSRNTTGENMQGKIPAYVHGNQPPKQGIQNKDKLLEHQSSYTEDTNLEHKEVNESNNHRNNLNQVSGSNSTLNSGVSNLLNQEQGQFDKDNGANQVDKSSVSGGSTDKRDKIINNSSSNRNTNLTTVSTQQLAHDKNDPSTLTQNKTLNKLANKLDINRITHSGKKTSLCRPKNQKKAPGHNPPMDQNINNMALAPKQSMKFRGPSQTEPHNEEEDGEVTRDIQETSRVLQSENQVPFARPISNTDVGLKINNQKFPGSGSTSTVMNNASSSSKVSNKGLSRNQKASQGSSQSLVGGLGTGISNNKGDKITSEEAASKHSEIKLKFRNTIRKKEKSSKSSGFGSLLSGKDSSNNANTSNNTNSGSGKSSTNESGETVGKNKKNRSLSNYVTQKVNIKELPWHIAPTQSLSQPNFDKLTLGDFERVTNLGRGGYARVYLVRLKKEPNKTYALDSY